MPAHAMIGRRALVLTLGLILVEDACRGTFRGNVSGRCSNQIAEADGSATFVVPLDGEGGEQPGGKFRFKGRFKADERTIRRGDQHWKHDFTGGIEYDW